MVVGHRGDVHVTSQGAKLLQMLDIRHAGARVFVDVALAQSQRVGDGTTTAVLIAGHLLHCAVDLICQRHHPAEIIQALASLDLQVPSCNDALSLTSPSTPSRGSKSRDLSIHDRTLSLRPVCQQLLRSALGTKLMTGAVEVLCPLIEEAMLSTIVDDANLPSSLPSNLPSTIRDDAKGLQLSPPFDVCAPASCL